jgi:hypothetical protein
VVHEEYKQKAIRLLKRQLLELKAVRVTNYKSPMFKAWHVTTSSVLETFLGPHSNYTNRFRNTRFLSLEPFDGDFEFSDDVSTNDGMTFRSACDTTEASLKAAIRHVEDFGVYIEEAKPAPAGRGRGRSGGVHFNAPVHVHNFAVAADSAVMRISHLGDKTGADLKEISDLLQQSQDLAPNQVRQGVADIEALAVEVEKPEEKRNWRSVLERGQRIMELAGKAVDLGAKLAQYTPTIVALVEKARHAV